jgi:hypothetical protein
MSVTPYVWFIATLVLLVLVQRWIHKHLHGIAYLISRDPEMALVLYALPLLPGVALHELSHWLIARLLGVNTGTFSIVPRRSPDGRVRLGSVQVENVDAFRTSLIGLAPLFFGSIAVLLISYLAFGVSSLGDAVQSENIGGVIASLGGVLRAPDAWLWLYLLFVIANAMLPSPADRQTWPPVILFGFIMLALALIFGWSSAVEGVGRALGEVLRWLAGAFTIALVVDIPFGLIISLLEPTVSRVTGHTVEYSTDVTAERQSRQKNR